VGKQPLADRRRCKPEVEHPGARPATRDGFLARLSKPVEDREAVALRVIRPLLGEEKTRPNEELEPFTGVRNALDKRVVEDTNDVTDAEAAGPAVLPRWVVADGEGEQGFVRRAPVEAVDKRRKLRRDPAVDLDDLCEPLRWHEELDVEEAAVEVEGGQHAGGDVRELGLPFLGQACRIFEPLEAERARVLERVRHADRRHAPSVDVALERYLQPRQELLGEEPVRDVGTRAGERGDRSIPRGVAVDLLQVGKLHRVVDAEGVLREAADHRLHEERRVERRRAVEDGEARRGLGGGVALDPAGSGLVLTRQERLRRRPREAATLGEDGREERGLVLRSDDAVRRDRLAFREEARRIEVVELVQVRPDVANAVAPRHVCGVDANEVPRLRAENEEVSHRLVSAPPGHLCREIVTIDSEAARSTVRRVLDARSDVVGSLLRPQELLEARERFARGELSETEFERIEDGAVDESIRLQDDAGLDVVTDGEMRRLSFQSQMTEAVEGFGDWDLDAFLWGEWQSDELGELKVERPPIAVVGKLRRKRFLSADEAAYALGRTSKVLKVTLPSPSLFANFWDPERSSGAYARLEDFLADAAEILREEVDELVRLGITYIQLDAPHYPLLVDPSYRDFYASRGWPAERWLELGLELDNLVIGEHPGVTFGFHLCKGNQVSRWLVSGGYDWLAGRIFPHIRADRLLLEYDDERSGTFEPLTTVPEDKTVVLGLVTTKSGRRETLEELAGRIRDAARFVPLERLALSPQCGFATSIVGNALSVEDERAKLETITRTAATVWG
jgi:5-methyltetrahydropteroyltriglutamate--homocysteine methyltransferase